MAFLCSKEQFKVGDKSRSEFFEGYVTDVVALFDELGQVVVHGAVLPIAALAFDFADLFGVILVMLIEHGKQDFIPSPKKVLRTFSAVT